ncbi:MAG TPA: thymidine phosphorylase, partial [Blastocatellia bacterium]
GIDGLVLDVKTGNGAFMREFDGARKLAEMMALTGRAMGKRVIGLITDMNQPLGRWVGNAVETMEAIETLRGDLEGDFAELCLELAARMLIAGGVETDLETACDKAIDAITSGRALERFRACVEAQGGDPRVLDDAKLLPQAREQRVITAGRKGFVTGVETDEIGRVVMDWGGGRLKLEDEIDHAVGLRVHLKIGDQVNANDPLVTAYYNDESKFEEMSARLRAAYRIEDAQPPFEALIKAVI